MKRSLRSMLFLLLAVCTLTVTAFADMGPKSQLIVHVKNAPDGLYYLDLLAEGDSANLHDYLSKEERAELDPVLLDKLISAVPEGWHACVAQGVKGAPIFGSLTAREPGLHHFSYHGVPWTYRVLMVTETGEVYLSDTYTRKVLQSAVTLNWADKVITTPPVSAAYTVQFLATFLPTLLVEGFLLALFKLWNRKNFLVFLLANLVTQGGLAAYFAIDIVKFALRGRFYANFFAAEIVVLLVERFFYHRYFTRGSETRIFAYALTANLCTLLLGFILANPIWRCIHTILTT